MVLENGAHPAEVSVLTIMDDSFIMKLFPYDSSTKPNA